MVKINGETLKLAGETLPAYLERAGYDIGKIAVEYNGSIIDRGAYANICLKDGDVLEIVCFMGGG